MIELPDLAEDSEAFVSRVAALIRGLVRRYQPSELIVVRIDNWFDPKWLGFSGEVHGTLGVGMKELTLPPFEPTRVVSQHRYKPLSSGDYGLSEPNPPLHLRQASSGNLKRLVANVAPGATLVWFSSTTSANTRGSIMAYVPTFEVYWAWYAEFVRNEAWQTGVVKGISQQQLAVLESGGAVCGADADPDP